MATSETDTDPGSPGDDTPEIEEDRIVVPEHVKYREEAAGGLVYEHENYGYEDATLTTVSEPVIDVLEHVDRAGGCPRSALESEFGAETVRTLVEAGFLAHE